MLILFVTGRGKVNLNLIEENLNVDCILMDYMEDFVVQSQAEKTILGNNNSSSWKQSYELIFGLNKLKWINFYVVSLIRVILVCWRHQKKNQLFIGSCHFANLLHILSIQIRTDIHSRIPVNLILHWYLLFDVYICI